MPPKTLKEEKLGKIGLRIVQRENGSFAGRYQRQGQPGEIIDGGPDETQEELWQRLVNEALKEDPSFFGYEGAIARFLDIFPDGFETPRYLEQERDYKRKARELLNERAPVTEAANGTMSIDGIIEVFEATNLLHWNWERPKIVKALRGSNGRMLVQHLANFALGDGDRLPAVAAICNRYDASKWPIVTYLPFLWDSGHQNALLRYTPTAMFAARVGHPFPEVYEARLDLRVYQSLLDLFATTEGKIAVLNPRDWIDVQSFVWVVSEYRD